MKLRIRGNSIRLRLGRSEVERMVETGLVEEFTIFDAARRQRLGYALRSSSEVSVVTATFDEGQIVVSVPADLIRLWGTTDQVGIDAVQNVSEGEMLRILIEKDFECIDAPVHESQEDAFPRPDAGIACAATTSPGRGAADEPA